MICSWTPSSVCGPWKQAQMVSMILSMSFLPGAVLSGALPVRWPYAISFYKVDTHADTYTQLVMPTNMTRSPSLSWWFLHNSSAWMFVFSCLLLNRYRKWQAQHTVHCHTDTVMEIWRSAVQLVPPLTCKQSSEVMTMRGHLDWHASSNGKKYLSASMKLVFDLIGGKVLEPDLPSPLGGLQ